MIQGSIETDLPAGNKRGLLFISIKGPVKPAGKRTVIQGDVRQVYPVLTERTISDFVGYDPPDSIFSFRRQTGMKRDTAGTYTQGKGKSNTGGKTLPFLQQEDSGQSQKTGNEWKNRTVRSSADEYTRDKGQCRRRE